jgi:hypothetical protein
MIPLYVECGGLMPPFFFASFVNCVLAHPAKQTKKRRQPPRSKEAGQSSFSTHAAQFQRFSAKAGQSAQALPPVQRVK